MVPPRVGMSGENGIKSLGRVTRPFKSGSTINVDQPVVQDIPI